MKIEGHKPPETQDISRVASQRPAAPEQKDGAAAPERAASPDKVASRDRIDISSKGKEIAEFMAAIEKMPEVREEKIQAIQEAIRSGKYEADPRKIAEGILRDL